MFHVEHIMEVIEKCPLCGTESFNHWLTCEDYTVSRESFAIVRCDECGFLFTNPRPKEDQLGRYYQSEAYISHSDTSKGIVNKLYKIVRKITLARKYRMVKPYLRTNRLLDVGCGTGAFLDFCKRKGAEVYGVEPDAGARGMARDKYGIEPKEEAALKLWPEKNFDVITLWHVLEHVPRLNERVVELRRLLNDEGRLFIAVPDYRSADAGKYGKYWAAYDVPRHLYHFDRQTIERLFRNHDLVLERVLPMKFDAYYVSLQSEKFKHGRTRLFPAFFSGFHSNRKAKKGEYSSQIYVFRK